MPLLKDMDEGVLVEISEKLHPEKYTPGKIIIKKNAPLQMMLYIVDGHLTIEREYSGDVKPIINESVQAIDDVQALVLSATDMATLSFSSRRHINELRMVVTILQKVSSSLFRRYIKDE